MCDVSGNEMGILSQRKWYCAVELDAAAPVF